MQLEERRWLEWLRVACRWQWSTNLEWKVLLPVSLWLLFSGLCPAQWAAVQRLLPQWVSWLGLGMMFLWIFLGLAGTTLFCMYTQPTLILDQTGRLLGSFPANTCLWKDDPSRLGQAIQYGTDRTRHVAIPCEVTTSKPRLVLTAEVILIFSGEIEPICARFQWGLRAGSRQESEGVEDALARLVRDRLEDSFNGTEMASSCQQGRFAASLAQIIEEIDGPELGVTAQCRFVNLPV